MRPDRPRQRNEKSTPAVLPRPFPNKALGLVTRSRAAATSKTSGRWLKQAAALAMSIPEPTRSSNPARASRTGWSAATIHGRRNSARRPLTDLDWLLNWSRQPRGPFVAACRIGGPRRSHVERAASRSDARTVNP